MTEELLAKGFKFSRNRPSTSAEDSQELERSDKDLLHDSDAISSECGNSTTHSGGSAEIKGTLVVDTAGNAKKELLQVRIMQDLAREWRALRETDKKRFEEAAADDLARYEAAVASNPANSWIAEERAERQRAKEAEVKYDVVKLSPNVASSNAIMINSAIHLTLTGISQTARKRRADCS